MIKNKFLLSLLIVMLFSTAFICAANKNFFTILNGSNSKTVELSSSKSSVFIGQASPYATVSDGNTVSRSSFASVIKSASNIGISFVNNTGEGPFSESTVTLKVTVTSTSGTIDQVAYRVWQGENVNEDDWTTSPQISYTGFTPASTVEFTQEVTFDKLKTTNFFRVYAHDDSGQGGKWSAWYTVKLDSSLSDSITFTAPDRLTALATIDPTVQTTEYDINVTTATVSLFEGEIASGTPLYEINISSTNNSTYKMYNETESRLSYVHSDFVKIYNENPPTPSSSPAPVTLKNNQKYTLKIITAGHEEDYDTLTFTALSGGVADVLTYPSPFNPRKEKIKIRYLLAKDARVTIKIYDKAGKFVAKVIQSESRNAGTNEDEWDGKNYAGDTLATGPYICEVIAKGSNGEQRRYTALALVN